MKKETLILQIFTITYVSGAVVMLVIPKDIVTYWG